MGCGLPLDVDVVSVDPEAPVGRLPLDADVVVVEPEVLVGCRLPLDAEVASVNTESPMGCRLPLDADFGGMDPEAKAPVGVGGIGPGSRISRSADSNVTAAAS